jgi:hypothetical protein
MIDPPRLADDDGPGAALLRAARHETPATDVLDRTLAAVAAVTAAGVITSAVATKTAAKTSLGTVLKFLLIGAAAGTLTVGGAAVVHYSVTEAPAARATDTTSNARPHPVTTVPRSPVVSSNPAPESAPPALGLGERISPPAARTESRAAEVASAHRLDSLPSTPSPAGSSTAQPATEPADGDSAMSAEVRLLDEARRALGEGRSAAALAAVERYEREAPTHRLAPEAAYLQMEANRALGDRAAAVRSAQVLLNLYPDGPHAARARRILHGE